MTSDGLKLCEACERLGVRDEAHARAILLQVRQDLHGIGFQGPAVQIPIKLVSVEELNPKGSGRHSYEGRLLSRRWDDGTAEFLDMSIQRGLPPVSCGRIIAHELGHAWLLWKGYRDLQPLKAEGLCELCAWLWMTNRKRPHAAFKAKSMERNPDPVYGDGFRAAWKAYRSGGHERVSTWLGRSH